MAPNLTALYSNLTASLIYAGTRRLEEGQTTAELMVESSMASALNDPLQAMYRYPFRGGVSEVPDTSERPAIAAWLTAHYQNRESAADLRATLPAWLTRAANVGGQLGLEEIGAGGVFTLRGEDVQSRISDSAEELTTLGGYHSLVDTTVDELTIQLSNGRLAGLTNEELNAHIAGYIARRAPIRAGIISLDQVILWVNVALREVYLRNGISFEIFKTRPEASQTGPCPLCAPLDGGRYTVGTGPSIPVHVKCVCVYVPDTSDWTLPAEVWRG